MLSDILAAFPPIELIVYAAAALVTAYTIFGITGFGSGLIAAPVLAQVMPISSIVPLLSILDCAAAITNGVRIDTKADRRELALLFPAVTAGTLIGAVLLFHVPTRFLMLALGIFIILYAAWSFFIPRSTSRIGRAWAIPIGTIGGIISGLFGMGGAIYAMYVSRRFEDRDAIRATQSAVIGLGTLTRVVTFAFAGSYSDWRLILLAFFLVPIMFLGIFAGHHLTPRMSRRHFFALLYLLLVVSGIALILRATTANIVHLL
jgi:uncharacterized membrane protein YfcA